MSRRRETAPAREFAGRLRAIQAAVADDRDLGVRVPFGQRARRPTGRGAGCVWRAAGAFERAVQRPRSLLGGATTRGSASRLTRASIWPGSRRRSAGRRALGGLEARRRHVGGLHRGRGVDQHDRERPARVGAQHERAVPGPTTMRPGRRAAAAAAASAARVARAAAPARRSARPATGTCSTTRRVAAAAAAGTWPESPAAARRRRRNAPGARKPTLRV